MNPFGLDLICFVDFDGDYYKEAFDKIKSEATDYVSQFIFNKAKVVKGDLCKRTVHSCEAIVNSEKPEMS